MADVYRGHDQSLDRDVAIKILLPRFGEDPVFVERFQREAKSAAKLSHPNIVQVYATGRAPDNEFYIVMEYVDGGSLDDRLRTLSHDSRVLEKNFTLHLMRQMALALSTAHKAGIVHRDIKPSNLLIRQDNTPVLTDLGIAALQDAQKITQTDRILGTPGYMSPEQASSGAIDGRSDIYSFGIMLFELLSGERPFKGDTPWATINQHINTPPPAIKKIRPDLRPETLKIVTTCLEKDPAHRYQTADELAYALELALIAEGGADQYGVGLAPPVAGAPRRTSQTGSFRRKRRIWPYFLVLMLLFCGTLGALFSFGIFDPLLASLTPAAPPTATPTATITPTSPPVETSTPIILIVTPTPLPEASVDEDEDVTAEPEDVPTVTATATTATATPTATATATSSNASGAGSGAGLPIQFDQGAWGIGDEANGTFTLSTDRATSGSQSGKLSYSFDTADNDYVVFLQTNEMNGEPNTMSAQVYGDGSGHFLNIWIRDAQNQVWQVPLGQVNHSGRWATMSGDIDPTQDWPWTHIRGPKNEIVEYPITFIGIVLDDLNNTYTGSGTIYIDDITTGTSAASASNNSSNNSNSNSNSSTTAPAATDTPETSQPLTGDIGRILYTSGNTILTTDPSWSLAKEVGTASTDTCSGAPALVTGQTFSTWRGNKCGLPEGTAVCISPNGAYEAIINHAGEQLYTINVRQTGDESVGVFIYQTYELDRAEGFQWSPQSNAFMFVENDQIFIGFPTGGYNASVSPVYNPIYSPDGNRILYRRPVGPGVNDVFVANSDGTGQTNLTNNTSLDKQCAVWVP